jgi:pSer/pThr/pTyr-binding forkhead associated (FHA) protein
MAYLIFHSKGRELGRRLLQGPLVIGRSPECDVCVHDILLSRRHCRIEPRGGGWRVIDLNSRNGTHLGGKCIQRERLSDGTVIGVGKATITYRAGAFAPVGRDQPLPARRAADPWEALCATVSGFEYVKTRARETERIGLSKPATQGPIGAVSRFPTPQPNPPDPDSYSREDVYSMLTELTSSSWDSIYFNASRSAPRRPAPRPMVHAGNPRSWQCTSAPQRAIASGAGLLAPPARPRVPSRRWGRALTYMARGLAAAGQMIMISGFLGLVR